MSDLLKWISTKKNNRKILNLFMITAWLLSVITILGMYIYFFKAMFDL